jgi:hypothetical protein
MGFFDSIFKNESTNNEKPSVEQKSAPALTSPAACPHCGTVLDKVPTRKAKCPHCGKDMYIRSKQILFPQSILTESQADAVDAIKNFEFLGLSDNTFKEKQAQLSAKLKTQASVDDTLWSIYNGLITSLARSNDFSQMSIIYSQMAVFLVKRGKDGQRMMIEANKMTMRDYAKMGVIDFEIINDTQACSTCKALSGKLSKMTRELVESPLLPPNGCTCESWKGKPPLCACSYVAKSMKSSLGNFEYKVN